MSGHQGELDALVRSARAERPRGRWQAQRQLFLRLGLGGGAAMLVARASAAFGPFIRAQRSTLGVAGLALAAAGVLATVYATNLPDAREAAVPSVVPAPSSSAGEHHSVSAEASIPTVSVDARPAVRTRTILRRRRRASRGFDRSSPRTISRKRCQACARIAHPFHTGFSRRK